MEQTYEKEGDLLKITTPRVRLVSREELEAEKAAIEKDKEAQEAQFTDNMATLNTRLATVNERIQKADELNIPTIEESE